MLLLTQAVDLAIGGVERGNQGNCAIAFVVMVWPRPFFSGRPG